MDVAFFAPLSRNRRRKERTLSFPHPGAEGNRFPSSSEGEKANRRHPLCGAGEEGDGANRLPNQERRSDAVAGAATVLEPLYQAPATIKAGRVDEN